MGSQVLATIASVIMKLLVLFCVASCLVISSEGTGRRRKNADEAVSDAEGVYGVGLGDSLSSLEKRSAQPWWGGMAASNSVADPRRNLWIGKRSAQPYGKRPRTVNVNRRHPIVAR